MQTRHDRLTRKRSREAGQLHQFLQGKSLAGASFTSVPQLRRHIDDFINAYKATFTPFVCTTEVH